jgi:hypothetical protein
MHAVIIAKSLFGWLGQVEEVFGRHGKAAAVMRHMFVVRLISI